MKFDEFETRYLSGLEQHISVSSETEDEIIVCIDSDRVGLRLLFVEDELDYISLNGKRISENNLISFLNMKAFW